MLRIQTGRVSGKNELVVVAVFNKLAALKKLLCLGGRCLCWLLGLLDLRGLLNPLDLLDFLLDFVCGRWCFHSLIVKSGLLLWLLGRFGGGRRILATLCRLRGGGWSEKIKLINVVSVGWRKMGNGWERSRTVSAGCRSCCYTGFGSSSGFRGRLVFLSSTCLGNV